MSHHRQHHQPDDPHRRDAERLFETDREIRERVANAPGSLFD